MKKSFLRSLSAILVIVMILTAIPAVFAAGEERIVTELTGSGNFSFGDKYFVVDNDLYAANGNKIATVPNRGEYSWVYSFGESAIIVITQYGADENHKETFTFYEIEGNSLEEKSTFENATVYPYDHPEYTTVVLNDPNDSSKYLGCFIIDGNGNEVIAVSGNCTMSYSGNNIFIETKYPNTDQSTSSAYDISTDMHIDLPGNPVSYLSNGSFVSLLDDGTMGVVSLDNQWLFSGNYSSITFENGYYICKCSSGYDSTYKFDAYNIDGGLVYRSPYTLTFFNGNIAVEEIKYISFNFTDTRIVDPSSGDILAEGNYYERSCNMHILITKSNTDWMGQNSYIVEDSGNVLLNGIGGGASVDDEIGTFNYYDYNEGIWKICDAMGNVKSTSTAGNIINTSNGFQVMGQKSNLSVEPWAIMYNGHQISDWYESYEHCFDLGDYDVYLFSTYISRIQDYLYTFVVVDTSDFIDVHSDHWAYGYISTCYDMGLMNGTGGGAFSPAAQVSRAQVVTTLWRLAGSPAPSGNNTFTDVAAGQWYTDAVVWAAENGITSGVGGGYFAPDRAVTRGEVAAIIYRYASTMGMVSDFTADISSYPDANKLTDWNRDAFAWCSYSNIITGKSSSAGPILAPNDVLSRAEIATILCRFSLN